MAGGFRGAQPGARSWAPALLPLAGIALLALAPAAGLGAKTVLPLAIVLAVSGAFYSVLFRWETLLALLFAVLLFIPIGRYDMPVKLPLSLEPYRIYAAVLVLAWGSSLLIDPRVRLRRSSIGRPLLAILLAYLASDFVNAGRVHSLGVDGTVLKKLMFFVSFVLIAYMIMSLVSDDGALDLLIKIIVCMAAVVAIFTVIEQQTRWSLFNHLSAGGLLDFKGLSFSDTHDPRVRALGSADSPIAMGAGFAMLLPLTFYLRAKTGANRWLVIGFVLFAGLLATRSRTSILMLLAVVVVFALLRPQAVKRALPWVVPLVLAAHIASPGSLATLKESFFPKGGIIAQQQGDAGGYGSGRVADLSPGLRDWSHKPVLGSGFGTRVTERIDPRVNAPILDDQWLGTLIETGIVGFLAWIWLFVHVIRRLGRAAKEDDSARGWLFVGLTGAVAGYAVSMTVYDAFSFAQEALLLFILLGIGMVALRLHEEAAPAPVLHPLAPKPNAPRRRLSSASRV